ncbi:MAG: hypothetical protein MRZ91_02885 [Christensenellaceae bacterium]|nr:hypothetical protein [Christensenellaceae bacterium]
MNNAFLSCSGGFAVLDVGSNSVRAGIFVSGKLVSRTLITSRLGEGVENGVLKSESILRTVAAIKDLIGFAKEKGSEYICAFATEAVRRAANKPDFLSKVKAETGLEICVVSGEDEAELALTGALNGEDGTVIDLGGASTEVAVKQNGKTVYAHSLGLGAVILNDLCGRDKCRLSRLISQKVAEYGEIAQSENVVAIGGTATSIAAYFLKLKEYDSKKIHGTVISLTELASITDELFVKEPAEIYENSCVDRKRAEILFGGALLLKAVAEKCGAKKLVISESDNLEGFYIFVARSLIKPEILKIQ